MRVAFIQKDPLPDPRLMTLGAAVVFRGHQARAFLPAAESGLAAAMRRYAPAIVVFAPCTGHHTWAIKQARALRPELGSCPMVFCGPHAEDFPEIVQEEGVDLLMVGDPESTLPELLFKISKERELHGTGGTVSQGPEGPLYAPARAMIDNIDQLPQPDLEIYKRYGFVRNQSSLSFAVGRGVLENTHAGASIGQQEWKRRFAKARRHHPDEAIARINLALRRRKRFNRIALRDCSFLPDPDGWRDAFLDRYQSEIGLPFSCMGRADFLDPESVRALKQAGCSRILLDISAAAPHLRKEAAGHPISEEMILAAGAVIREAGIRLYTRTFLGHPGETTEDREAALDLNRKLAPDHAFAMPIFLKDGPMPEALRSALAFPLAVRSAFAGSALRDRSDAILRRVFQAHHDMSFVTSGELPLWDIARIGLSMRR